MGFLQSGWFWFAVVEIVSLVGFVFMVRSVLAHDKAEQAKFVVMDLPLRRKYIQKIPARHQPFISATMLPDMELIPEHTVYVFILEVGAQEAEVRVNEGCYAWYVEGDYVQAMVYKDDNGSMEVRGVV